MERGKLLAEKQGKSIAFKHAPLESLNTDIQYDNLNTADRNKVDMKSRDFEELLLGLKEHVKDNTNHHIIYYTLYFVLSHYYSNLAMPPLMLLLDHHEIESKQAGLNLIYVLLKHKINARLFIPVLGQLNAFYLKDSFDLLAIIDKREFYTQIGVFIGYYDKLDFLFQLVMEHKDVYYYHLYSDLYLDTIISQQPSEFYLDFLFDLYSTCPFMNQTLMLIYCANCFKMEKSRKVVELIKLNPSLQFTDDLKKLKEFDSCFDCF
ncbi:hypothetical protein HDV01_007293 [Terramyces sp. JEL0728]|nr:hypothetical protein HDV01_007293 [Terramyces sp. JEL0728]